MCSNNLYFYLIKYQNPTTMKIKLALIIALVGIFFQMNANDGSNCNQPLTAFEGINNSVFNGYWDQYYKYTAPSDGVITISTKGITDNYADIWVYSSNCSGSFINQNSGSNGIELSFNAYKGDSFLIGTYMSNSTGTLPWLLSFATKILPVIPGRLCNYALQALNGTNNIIRMADNLRQGQWFVFSPPKSGHIAISSKYNDEDYIEVYTQCGGSELTSGWAENYPTYSNKLSFDVSDTSTYYIFVASYNVYSNGDSSSTWNFAYTPLSSATLITSVNFYDENKGNYTLSQPTEIDTINHTLKAYVSVNTNLSNYNDLIFYLSPYATISKNGNPLSYWWYMNDDQAYHYYDGGSFNDTTFVYTVTSEDKSKSTDWAVTIVNSTTLSTENKFLLYVIDNDTATIDTISHTIKDSVYNTNISSLYTLFTISPNASVSYNGSTFYSSSYYNYSDTLVLTVTSESGTSQDWNVIISQTKGVSCSNPIIAKIGVNYGNNNYTQYFSFTAKKSGNIIFSTTSPEFLMYMDTGNCSSLHQINASWIYSNSSINIAIDSGKIYTILTYYLYSGNFIISYPSSCNNPSIAKDGVNNGKGLSEEYFKYIATQTGDVTFSTSSADFHIEVDSGNCSSLKYLNDAWVYSSNSITMAVVAGKIYSIHTQYLYSDSFTISYPVSSCNQPTIASDGLNYGDGLYEQYFTYTATKSAFVNASTNSYFYAEIDTGSCSSLQNISSGNSPIGFKVEAGKKYTLHFWNLYSNNFTITTSKVVQKEITLFEVYNGNNWFSASTGNGIDTINKTINITIEPFDNLTNLYYDFNRLDYNLTSVKENNSTFYDNGNFDFSAPVTLTIIGADSTKTTYTVIIIKRTANTGSNFISFFLPTQTGNAIIDPDAHTIKIGVTNSTNITSLQPYFTLSYKATATDSAGNPQVSGSSVHNFTNTVVYYVMAEDSSVAIWKVIVIKGDTLKSNLANFAVFHFGITNENTVIDNNSKIITVTLPYGTDNLPLQLIIQFRLGLKHLLTIVCKSRAHQLIIS